MSGMNKRIQDLLDKQDIYEVLVTYCRGIDRGDVALMASCYHKDGIDDHGFRKERGADFAQYIIDLLHGSENRFQHIISNVLIELDGDLAFVESYFQAVSDNSETRLTGYGRYLDRFERRDGVWKIQHRLVVRDVQRSDPVRANDPAIVNGTARPNRRSDPLYAIRSMGVT